MPWWALKIRRLLRQLGPDCEPDDLDLGRWLLLLLKLLSIPLAFLVEHRGVQVLDFEDDGGIIELVETGKRLIARLGGREQAKRLIDVL